MSYARSILGGLIVALALVRPVSAQDHAVNVFARSGGFNALTKLNDAGTVDLKKVGYNIGGGVGVQVQRYVTLRGDFTYGQNELRTGGLTTGPKLNRFFYDGAVQLQYPTASGFEPYVFAGGGAVTIHQIGTTGQDETKGTGTFGVGVNYTVPRTGFGLFAEGKSWLYKPSSTSGALSGVDNVQYEVAWTGGVSYRFPF